MWTIPRSLSTAFEISISTLPGVKAIHEPFMVPYTRNNPYEVEASASSLSDLDYSFEDAKEMIMKDYPGITAVFSKNHVLTIKGNYEALLDEKFTHSFLIRNPQRVILSNYNLGKEMFMEAHSRDEFSFRHLHDFYFFLRRHLSTSLVIIDADDLLANPEEMMELYCKNVGLTYKHGMTKWESGRGWGPDFQKEIFYTDPAYKEAAIKSTGFKEPTPLPTLSQDLPIEVRRCIQDSFTFYNELYKLRSTL